MKKTLIIVLISCFGIFIVLTLILNSKDENYIIFDNNLFLSINDGRVSEISSDLLFDRDYNAFYQKEYIGKYELHSIDDEFGKLFFSNSKSNDTYSFETPYLAITPGIKFIPFEAVDADIDDLSLLSFDLDKYWISSIDDLNVFIDSVNYEKVDGENTLTIVLDSEEMIPLNIVVMATRILNPILDKLDLISESYTLDVYAKSKGDVENEW